MARVENINGGLNLSTHKLLFGDNHNLQVFLLTVSAVSIKVLTFPPKRAVPGYPERVKLKIK